MKRFIKIFFLGALAGIALSASADFDQKLWQYKSKITVADTASQYVAFDLLPQIFEKSKPDLSDLRIVSGSGETPYTLITENTEDAVSEVPVKMFNLGTVLGRNTSFILDVGRSGVLHSRVTIQTPSENFKRGVAVYGSDDRANWQLLNGKGQIFDYTNHDNGYLNARFTSVAYPQAAYRYLKVVVDDTAELPINITGATLDAETIQNARKVSYSPTFKIAQNQQERSTEIVADLGSSGTPTSEGELKTSDDIFGREIKISDSADGQSWTPIGSGYIFSVDTPKFSGTNLKFNYNESRNRYIKISVANGDNEPLSFTGVTLSGIVRKVLFSYQPGQSYDLYFGNSDAVKPEYDIEKFSQYLDASKSAIATAGAVEANVNFSPAARPFFERFPQALDVGLVIVVLLLFGLVVKLFRSVK